MKVGLKSFVLLPLMAVLLVSGCAGESANTAERAAKHDSSTDVAPVTACPAADFHAFLKSFSEDVAVQTAFTARPLQVDSLDANAEPEPTSVTSMVSDVSFPVLPREKERVEKGLVVSVDSVTTDEAIVRLVKPDTDYQVLYYFKRSDCWTLYRKKDESI